MPGDGVALLSVRDNGIGIDAGDAAHVFEAFTQGQQRSDRRKAAWASGWPS